jgi:sugar phosphate isomerase/epimerase
MRLGTSMLAMWPSLFERVDGGRVICNRSLVRDYINQLPARGVEHLEFTWVPPKAMEELFDEEWRDFLESCQSDLGLTFSVHLPHYGLDVSAPHEEIANISLEESIRAIQHTEGLNMTHYVLHAGITCGRQHGRLSAVSPVLLEYLWEKTVVSARQTLPRLLEWVGARKIAVENLPYAPLEVLAPVIFDYDLGVCLDVGHADRTGDDPAEFFARYKDRISVIHFHDVKDSTARNSVGGIPDHQALGTGHIGYRELIGCLAREGFDGELIIEVQIPSDDQASTKLTRIYLDSLSK